LPKRRKKKGAEEAPVTGPECSYKKKVAGPAPKAELPEPEKTRAVVESVA
jgi:DNA topoisomerase-1